MIIKSEMLVSLLSCLLFAIVTADDSQCEVRLRIKSGWICGRERLADNGVKYASFRGIPYAQQPLGKLRFQELRPVKSWTNDFDATEEGPACPQDDQIYETLVKPRRNMSESCINANVHIPMTAFNQTNKKKAAPIFVFIHGGAFHAGSGDSDIHGPEFLVSKGVIVITFNYRLNVFGFLSLNSTKIPGNNGLRDQLTLLRWVQKNAKAFGGDPKDVTLAGQSAGAVCAHLLALSNATKGLFKRVILMSGTAIPAFYPASPVYASGAATGFLSHLNINSSDPDVIHDKLVKLPLEEILRANSLYQQAAGLVSFVPVVEGEHPGVTRIVDDEPVQLIKQGRAKEYPMLVGYTSAECEFFRKKLINMQILKGIEANPLLILPARVPFSSPPDVALNLALKVIDFYFDGELTIDRYMHVCRDSLFENSVFKLAQWRADMDSAPTYLYQFSYDSEFNVLRRALQLKYNGSAHIEDSTYILSVNSVLSGIPLTESDKKMTDWMTDFVVNFMRFNAPTTECEWPPVTPSLLNYQDINQPGVYKNTEPTQEQLDVIKLYDEFDN